MNNMESFEELMKRQEPLDPELKPWLEKGSGRLGWPTLKHPLVFGIPYMEAMNAMYNAQLKAKKEYAEEAIQNKKWSSYLYIHERPYRFNKFIEIEHLMTDREYWDNLGSIWSDSENIWQYKAIITALLLSKRGDREHFMDEREREFLENLPEEFIIYRGHQGINRSGYSWTLSYWRARWFAQRFDPKKNGVVQAIVNKKDIIGVLLGRGEYEIVTLPNRLKIETCKKIAKRPVWMESVLKEAWSRFSLVRAGSFHGLWHWEKVEKNAVFLANNTPGADKTVAQLFALIHDSKRQNEDEDPEHGHRSAAWAEELFKDGRLKIKKDQLEKLVEACKYHNDGNTSEDPTIGVCWDADRLDLPRVGITPDPKYLSTETAKKFLWRI